MSVNLDPISIDPAVKLPKSQDYAYLREQGIVFIRELAGLLWTDHNTHDPGITTLELLSYALTDLAYRTNFPMEDLLKKGPAEDPNFSNTGLFPAHEILPTCPLTINDYRKLLLKIEDVRNAWLRPLENESEVPVYADCSSSKLTFQNPNDKFEKICINGLYDVLLELEIDDLLGSLNEKSLTYKIPFGDLKGVVLQFDITDDFDPSRPFNGIDLLLESDINQQPKGDWKAKIKVALDGQIVTFDHLKIIILEDKPSSADLPIEIEAAKLKKAIEGPAGKVQEGLFGLFWQKQQRIARVIDQVGCVLMAHRNLCEDFRKIERVETEQIAICLDIETQSNADIEVLKAKIMLAIEHYFNPPVKYYTLLELVEEGLKAEDIFDGPFADPEFACGGQPVFTKYGFVKTDELEETELKTVLYASDLINILMDFEEIITVKNLFFRKYNEAGKPAADAEPWSQKVTPGKQAVLDQAHSKFLFLKNSIPYTAKVTESEETLQYLRATKRKEAYVSSDQSLPVPEGRYRDLHEFFPVQHDFPDNYGVGQARLPLSAPPKRLGQAKQMKAYLLFFEQVLADYLEQLLHAKWLLSPEDIAQTYFSRYIDQNDIVGLEKKFEEEFYFDNGTHPLLEDPKVRTKLYESKEQFLERRNRLLDHLLARFAEQFTDYVLLLFNLEGDQLKAGEDLINDKINFLKEYPNLSRARGKAFNYRPKDSANLWDSDNISGLERRLGRLVGIQNLFRRTLSCDTPITKMIRSQKISGLEEYFICIKDEHNNHIFHSVETWPNRPDAEAVIEKIAFRIRSAASYQIEDDGTLAIEANGVRITHNEAFIDQNDAEDVIRDIFAAYDFYLQSPEHCGSEINEGLYLIEHLLFRPLAPSTDDTLMNVCLPDDCDFCGEEDPYSFRVTAVLPYWPGRFNNIHFRHFFEKMIRLETPAHIHARICWIDNEQMALLSERYRTWLSEKARKTPDLQALTNAQRDLLEIFSQLNNVYPKATLHDCEEDGGDAPVRLGYTNLGTF